MPRFRYAVALFFPSELDSVTNRGYVPDEVLRVFEEIYSSRKVIITDADFSKEGRFVNLGKSIAVAFDNFCFDEFYNDTGCWVFIAKVEYTCTYLFGLSGEYVLVVCDAESELLENHDKGYFREISKKIYQRSKPAISKDIFLRALNAVYS